MKTVKVNFIDNCSHGYYSVAKRDILKLGINTNEISSCSGLTLTRVYLEEDCDSALFFNKCKELGVEVIVNRTYNPSFQFHHSYSAKLFNFEAKVGVKLYVGKNKYTITSVDDKNIVVDNKYRIPLVNPFKLITDFEE